jgi:hypothetical protein
VFFVESSITTGEFVMTKITEVEVRDVCRISYAHIVPEGSMTLIGGNNAQGKTSLLDAICAVLGGGRLCPDRPIREGCDSASAFIILEADEKEGLPRSKVLRRWKRNRKGGIDTQIEIIDEEDVAEGDDPHFEAARAPAPQTRLNDLLSRVAFDPLEFANMKPSEQTARILGVLGVDFTEVDGAIERAFAARASLNKEYSRAEASVTRMPFYDDAPDQLIDVAELSAKVETAVSDNSLVEVAASRLSAVQQGLENIESTANMTKSRIADLEKALEAEKAGLEVARETFARETDKAKVMEEELKAMTTVDVASLQNQIREAWDANRRVQANLDRAGSIKDLASRRKSLQAAEDAVAAARSDKAVMIKGIEWPIEGISIGEMDEFLLNDIPFKQASKAEQILTSAAIGLASHPILKILIVREGALLDHKSLADLAELAAKSGGHVFVERVGEGSECDIIMRNGISEEAAEEVVSE